MRLNLSVNDMKKSKDGKTSYGVNVYTTTYSDVDIDRTLEIIKKELEVCKSETKIEFKLVRSL